jgi:splicing factor 1
MSSKANKRIAHDEVDEWSKDADKKKKRKSRWAAASETENPVLAGLPTVIPQGLTKDQEEQYLFQLQIEEITRRLRTGELGIPPNPEDRSPSPEPFYNNEGKRLNTREYRTRKKLEEERHGIILQVIKANPDYKPPSDYRPPLIRISDRVMIPQDEHPEINFVGLLIGPRGNTLRNLEKETGTSIIIRGKGSVKEGKVGHKDGRPLPGQDEPLHAYITATVPENVKKASERIKEIIKEGITVPDADNDLRKQQLRELALLNGTLREGDALSKLKQFQESQTILTNTILCIICGGAGHISADCKQRRPGETLKAQANPMQTTHDRAKMDSEYMSLMAELGQGGQPMQPPSAASFRSRTPLQLPQPTNKLAIMSGPASQDSWNPVLPPSFPSAPPRAPMMSGGMAPPPQGPRGPPQPLMSTNHRPWQPSGTSSGMTSNTSAPWTNNSMSSNSRWGNAPPSTNTQWGNTSSTSSNSPWSNNTNNPRWGNASSNPPWVAGSTNTWTQASATTPWSNSNTSQWGGGANNPPWAGPPAMSGPPVPPTPPSFTRWSAPAASLGGDGFSLAPPPPPPN